MAIEKKRPRGLKGSASSNKQRKVESQSGKEVDAATLPENAQTVVINKEVDEGDEVGEVTALYEEAVEKQDKQQQSEAVTILRGVIHESDRILRNWDDAAPLPLGFYRTYALALHDLGQLSDDDDIAAFVDEALARIVDGMDHHKSVEGEEMHKAKLVWGKIVLAKESLKADEELNEVSEDASSALTAIQAASNSDAAPKRLLLDVARVVQQHAELYRDLASRERFASWAEDTLARIQDEQAIKTSALHELGLGQLAWGNFWLDRLDDDADNEDYETKAQKAFQQAKKYLTQAKDASQEVTPQLLCDLAEAGLNEANFAEDEQQAKYGQVVALIEQAVSLGGDDCVLPEGLAIFIEEQRAQAGS
ncbi:nuclear pore complex subunit Nro1-domain-containing protein [Gongronella butleri]|nr:nuclear pore complex subunit Nro1-domain-containing protein [Gongronella butleri]